MKELPFLIKRIKKKAKILKRLDVLLCICLDAYVLVLFILFSYYRSIAHTRNNTCVYNKYIINTRVVFLFMVSRNN